MKFSEMPYTRPDYAAAAKELDSLTARLRGAASAQEQVALYKEYETLLSHLSIQATLCSIRHTVDTRDAFCCSRTWSWRRRPSPRRLSP